jgi:hypothetical protein
MPIPVCSLVINVIEIANMSLFGRLRKLDCKIESFRRKNSRIDRENTESDQGRCESDVEAKQFSA